MHRRNFLHATGGVMIGSMTHASGRLSDDFGPRLRVGQVGTQHAHAAGQLQTVLALPQNFEMVGVVEPDPERRRRLNDHPVYQKTQWISEDQLFETPELSLVAVETSVRDLLPTAQRCVEAGFHIHLDKPAGESMEDLVRLHQTALRNKRLIQMGYMYRYNPAFQFLYEAVEEGWLGKIFEVHGVMSKKVNEVTRQELSEYPGGSMFELGCHLIDPLLHILGKPTRVTPHNRRTFADKDDLLDNCLAVFDFADATATIRSSLVEPDGGRRRQFVVCGTKGTIAIRPLEPPQLDLTLDEPAGGFPAGNHHVELASSPGRYHGAWTDVWQAIRNRRPLSWSPDHDIAVQRAVLLASGFDISGFGK